MTEPVDHRARRLVILAEGQFGFHHGKTAVGVIRYGPDDVVAVIDSTQAGGNVSSILPDRDIPIVPDLDAALALQPRPDTLLIGIAPTGGRLPDTWRATILAAIRAGLDVHSGLHTFLGDDPEFAAAAREAGTAIVDYRRPPDRMETAVGRRHGPGKRVILTVGTDCAIGKMSVALELRRAARDAGRSASFVPTGQTGMMIDGWGAAVDRLISDFAQGTVEWMVEEGERRGDWVIVEGQGSLTHPGFSGVTLGLLHGAGPDLMVLCHNAMRQSMKGYEDGLPLRSLRELVGIYEDAAAWRRPPGYPPARVVAVALNTGDLLSSKPPDLALSWIQSASAATKLPAADPIREGTAGADRLARALIDARGRGAITNTS